MPATGRAPRLGLASRPLPAQGFHATVAAEADEQPLRQVRMGICRVVTGGTVRVILLLFADPCKTRMISFGAENQKEITSVTPLSE
jgi:hypothetical protein